LDNLHADHPCTISTIATGSVLEERKKTLSAKPNPTFGDPDFEPQQLFKLGLKFELASSITV